MNLFHHWFFNHVKKSTLELDSRGRMVSKMVLFLLCASMSAKMTDQAAPCSPNMLHPFTASRAALAIPIELHQSDIYRHVSKKVLTWPLGSWQT